MLILVCYLWGNRMNKISPKIWYLSHEDEVHVLLLAQELQSKYIYIQTYILN